MNSTGRAIDRLDSRSFERRLAAGALLILPVGALEAHGPHLPLGADEIQARCTAEALAPDLDAVIAPSIPFGACLASRPFPGTASLTLGTLTALLHEVLSEFVRMGARRLLVLSGHAERGHMAALRDAAARTMGEHPAVRIVVVSDYEFVYELRGELAPATDGHGGMLETSRVLALAPESVGAERPVVTPHFSPFLPAAPTAAEWSESVQGDTRPASAELGAKVQAHVLKRLREVVRDLLPA
ncbi:MAG: creatininase family protein [Thermoplasmata archaeon]|nr:creatininase family protein [Thermoplasmata archaeon]MCI4344560.1 creatininase family protein [Thermoplasmata archaeon]